MATSQESALAIKKSIKRHGLKEIDRKWKNMPKIPMPIVPKKEKRSNAERVRAKYPF